MPSQIWEKFGHSAVSCRFRYGSPTVDDDLSNSFAGMRITHSYDPNWYPDTGATNHMTGDARSMTQKSEYVGNDQVMGRESLLRMQGYQIHLRILQRMWPM